MLAPTLKDLLSKSIKIKNEIEEDIHLHKVLTHNHFAKLIKGELI